MKKYILKKYPLLYNIKVFQLRFLRHINNLNPIINFAKSRSNERLKYSIKIHQSLLRRKLGVSNPILQENKIVNLSISSSQINGLTIKPGETFSFWKLVGKTTLRKGYIKGMQLSQGEVRTGIGGGICQLANLLFWLALHSPLEIIERHHHSFDPFPDDRRVLPFGSGASVFYNYIDLRFKNNTNATFQINVWLSDKHLKGSMQCDCNWPFSYHVEERNQRFTKLKDKNFRENEIWRRTVDKKTGNTVEYKLIIKNFSEVKYEVKNDACSFV